MNSRERIECAWRFEEPDRVPLEVNLSDSIRADPRCARLLDLAAEYSDPWNYWQVPWGWMGLSPDRPVEEEEIECRPGEFRRVRHTLTTPAGIFTAITWHPNNSPDYHWEKRYISTLDDLEAITGANHSPRSFNAVTLQAEARAHVGQDAFLTTGIPHPFGALVRNTDQETVYSWLALEPDRIHRFLEIQIRQIVAELQAFSAIQEPQYFVQTGLEMAIPPWMGQAQFDEFILPHDSQIYAKIHRLNGKLRHHCHGNCMNFLVKMADMGIDGLEPLEPPPQGDVILSEAKRLVGDRMLLCGNITSPQFIFMTPEQVDEQVRQACADAKAGGGFILRTTGGDGGFWNTPDPERVLRNNEQMIASWLKYGRY